MAIGKSSEDTEEEFVLRSGPRSRLKREFAFAVRAQAEFVNLPGRTRSLKVYSSPSRLGVAKDSVNKKRKASDAAEDSKVNSEESEVNNGSALDNAMVVEDGGVVGSDDEVRNGSMEEHAITPTPSPRDGVSMDSGGKEVRTCSAAEEAKIDLNEIQADDGSGSDSAIVIDDTGGVGSNVERQNGLAEENTPPLTPPSPTTRRFTRSALKGNPDPMGISTEVTVLSERPADAGDELPSESNGCENETTGTDDEKVAKPVSLLRSRSAPKKRLELKMSKKIASTKFPSNVTELLATGLLEGVPVKYRPGGNKVLLEKGNSEVIQMRSDGREELQGTIKDGKILCYCHSCNGSKVVTAIQFEQHALSLRKHPAPNIYFENGKSIRDLLNACKTVPLENLEATVQTVARASPVKGAAICRKCKEPFHPRSQDGTLVIVCSKCLELEQPEAGPADEMDSSARLSTTPLIRKSSKSISKSNSSQKKNVEGRLTRKDLRLHKLVFMEDVLPDGTEVGYYVRGKRLLEGYKMGNGIFCRCCNNEVSPSQFEAHAGWASRRKPYLHIFTSNGVSLHELSLSLSKDQKFSVSDNDDLCTICADFGDLLCCDGCPRAFHPVCVGLSSIPPGDWYCSYCQNMFEKEKFAERNVNALAAGRVLGVDPIEQISKRCIRIVKTSEAGVTVCVLCRCHDFSKAGFGPRTVLLCDQCEKEFHVGCLKDHNMADLKELPKGKWFCCMDCSKIHAALEKLVHRGSEKLPDSLLDVIKSKHEEKDSNILDLDVQWRVLSGKIASSDSRLLLSKAVAIFHDCFDPIVDSALGRDLIPAMVYGRNMRDQEFGGMYCAVLTANSSIVSAGILRIFGKEVAELPLVATSKENQGQGYFQSLFSCIERLLGFLEVKNLLLPAADEAESIWTKRFGFKKISPEELAEYTKDSRMMVFEGTSMLHKQVPKCRIVGKPTVGG